MYSGTKGRITRPFLIFPAGLYLNQHLKILSFRILGGNEMQRFTYDLTAIPRRLEIILLADALVFPSTHITLSSNETSKPRLAAMKKTGYILLAPLADSKEDIVLKDGVLTRITSFGEPDSSAGKKMFGLDVFFRARLNNIRELKLEQEFSAEWIMQPDKKVPPHTAQDEEFKTRLKLLPCLFYDAFSEILKRTEPEYIQDFLELLVKHNLSKTLGNISVETLGMTLDIIAGVLNCVEADWDIRIPSIMIFREHDVAERFNLVLALLGSIADNKLFEETEENKTNPAVTSQKNNPSNKGKKDDNSYERRYNEIKHKIPLEARKEFEDVLETIKLEGKSQDSNKAIQHFETLMKLFLLEETKDNTVLAEAKSILDEGHWGMQKPKERILGHLAVRKHAASGTVDILCFVGPPGVGKTSLGESIARALGKKFIRFSLGGLRDESSIKGNELIYISTHPGQIIRGLIRAGSKNPVFMLDEIDKIGLDWRGDPSSALLEVLDPEQNKEFFDKNINAPFDLSRVFFICTANTTVTIPPTLLDRMEVIKLSGYTVYEKLSIAKIHLIPKIRFKFGVPFKRAPLDPLEISFTDSTIIALVEEYTDESGVRSLERAIAGIYRKIVMDLELENFKDVSEVKITPENLEIFAGKSYKYPENRFENLPPGCVPLFAVSESGGHFFYVGVMMDKGQAERKIKVTGVRGGETSKDITNLIEESVDLALDNLLLEGGLLYRKPEERISEGEYHIHVHVGDSAIPKDGPSAGVPILWAILSLLINEPIQPNLGATGEIDLRLGILGAVGGIREKAIAAHRAGIKRFIVSKENERDLDEVPWEIKEEIQFITKRFWWETLEEAFPQNPLIKSYVEKRRSSP